MMRFQLLALFLWILVAGCGQSPPPPAPTPPAIVKADALSEMQTVFAGSYTRDQIKARLDEAMTLYNVPINEDHYNRYGGALVTLTKDSGVPEMDILAYMIRNHVKHVKMSFVDMAALSAGFIKAGDK